jgi:putative phosphoribosyl transferase
MVPTKETLTAQSAVRIGPKNLPGELVVPAGAHGLVVFAHGSGSSRLSPRNTWVAERLRSRRLATLLFDLLTEAEAADRSNVFDIDLLSGRVAQALDWAARRSDLAGLRVGLFGASTGAAAALVAAAAAPDRIAAVVSRGGRPDLAGSHLGNVRAPTLLIVGGSDREVLRLNEAASNAMHCERRIEVVPGATHLFEEPGTLDAVADLAADWFATHLVPPPGPR